jgi:predicted naringenin-chalcone synthase
MGSQTRHRTRPLELPQEQVRETRVVISGMATALPAGWLSQTDAADAALQLRTAACTTQDHAQHKRAQLFEVLYRRSGVVKRHSVLLRAGDSHPMERQTFYEPALHSEDRGPNTSARMQRFAVEAPPLACAAADAALQDAGVDVKQIGHLVTVSCSGFQAPGWDLELLSRLGLRANVSRTHVGFMGCHGALNGLRVAAALSASQRGEAVLLCALELCTLHHQYSDDPQEMVANSLFADGAAAVVVQAVTFDGGGTSATLSVKLPESQGAKPTQPGILRRDVPEWEVVAQSSTVLPDSREMMSWRIGDHGFQMTLSPQVPGLIERNLRPWLAAWLVEQGLQLEAVAHWAVHPGGPRILRATQDALGLPPDALAVSSQVLRECGNMSSPTILFILDDLRRRGATGPCVALAFGPGMVVEAALLTLH